MKIETNRGLGESVVHIGMVNHEWVVRGTYTVARIEVHGTLHTPFVTYHTAENVRVPEGDACADIASAVDECERRNQAAAQRKAEAEKAREEARRARRA